MVKFSSLSLGGAALAMLLPLAAPAGAADYSASLSATEKSYTGKCPHKFTFKGTIKSKRAGKVQYKFIRSDGANAPVQTLNFSGPGAKAVSTNWTLGKNFSGWQAIQIVYPQQVKSNNATFKLRCGPAAVRVRPDLPPKPGAKFHPRPIRRPDLVVTDIKLDRSCRIHVTVANKGTGGVPNAGYHNTKGAAVQMYNGSKAWGGLRLAGVDPSKKLKNPGAAVSHTWFPGAANLKLKPGKYLLKVTVDNNGAVTESNEGNNTLVKKVVCGPVKIRPRPEVIDPKPGVRPGAGAFKPRPLAKPDLGMYGFLRIGKNRRQVKWGETIVLKPEDASLISNGKPAFDLYYSYREFDDVAAPGPFANKVFFKGDLVSQQTNLSLDKKQIKLVHTQAYLGPTNGRLRIQIDANGDVAEARENNNGPFMVNLEFQGF